MPEAARPVAQNAGLRNANSEARFFLGCGIGKPHVASASEAARANATTVEQELLAEGLIDPELYYSWLAEELGLGYTNSIDPDEVVRLPSTDVLLRRDGPLRLSRTGRQVTAIVPQAQNIENDKARLAKMPSLRNDLIVASPATIRKAVWQAGASERVRKITFALDQDHCDASARRVMTGLQGFFLAMTVYIFATGFMLWPFAAFLVLHVVLTVVFSAGILLRLCAIVATGFSSARPPPSIFRETSGLPVYTVLVALHDEAEMVPAIVSRIAALRWPKSLLDIKYVCETDDKATIGALERLSLPPNCEIVGTPNFGPKTKPKALQYALQGARGALVAVYDAEDKPAPGQLLEAWAAFRNGTPQLGCLQAPLAIANLRTSWISGLFALEYSGLFRVLIPFLARTQMPIPLGGTSNHFRRSALEAVGGWDPHNVTEDADLGLRLYAHGYRTNTLRSATVETAPTTLDVWTRQRTRWLKGWAQTWLVTMRKPVQTWRALGLWGFAIFQLMIAKHADIGDCPSVDVCLYQPDPGTAHRQFCYVCLDLAQRTDVDRSVQYCRKLSDIHRDGMARFYQARAHPAETPLDTSDTRLLVHDLNRRLEGAGSTDLKYASLGKNSARHHSRMGGLRRNGGRQSCHGAGEGNRTLVLSLGSFCSTIELHPRQPEEQWL